MITGPRVKEVGRFSRRPNQAMLMNMSYDDGRSSVLGANYDYYLGDRLISKNDDLYNTTPRFPVLGGLEHICKKHFSPEEVENVFKTSILDVLAKRQNPERLVIYDSDTRARWAEYFDPHRIIPDYHPLGERPQHKYTFGNNVEKFWYDTGICSIKPVPASVVAAGGAGGSGGGSGGASAAVVAAGGAGASASPDVPAAAAPPSGRRNPNEILPEERGDNEIRGGSRQTKKKQKKSKKLKTNKK